MLTKQPKFKFFTVDESRESIRLRERLFPGGLGCDVSFSVLQVVGSSQRKGKAPLDFPSRGQHFHDLHGFCASNPHIERVVVTEPSVPGTGQAIYRHYSVHKEK